VALTISPAIITSGEYQTVSAAPANGAALTFMGAANTGYQQNLMFAKQAFALAVRPLEILPGSVDCARETYKGLSVRVWPTADWTNDV
ncbi:P22 phage major capsid protein family protein, partial [Acinetobacter baumannii]